jgi:CO/xanthine dehydrogenase Mo-binding subunit
MPVHVAMLALRTGRPVKMVYSREESFYGHVHRHPAWMTYEHGATRDGHLVYVRADVTLDGGAYASSSTAVVANAAPFACGPYHVPNASIDARVAYTNNPPCGAMRGFGAVQVAFAHESQMDRLAAALGMDPVELRIRNAIGTGDRLPTGQVVDGPAPVRELLEELRAMPLPPLARSTPMDLRELPGGVANVTHGEGTVRGVGFAVGFKNIAFAEGFDDYSTARVRLVPTPDGPVAEVQTAAAEVGQGLVTVVEQIARTELDVERVVVLPSDTSVGSAGSTSASRQTWITGGAVQLACRRILERLAGAPLGDEPIEETAVFRHRPTEALDPETGQGDSIVALGFAAHRAVCDVDVELGLVRAVEVATTQDVGRIMNPLALEGQIQGGIAQGVGLALMEEIQLHDGRVRNASFTDYLMPTVLDMPAVRMAISETPHPHAPYGLNGVGEMPTIASTPAVVAAVRDATGRELPRVPLRPSDVAGVG